SSPPAGHALPLPHAGVIEVKMYGPSARFGRIPATIAGSVRAFIARKGPWFLVNLLVFGALAIWLVFAIARSSTVFEQSYLIVRVIALGYAIIFAYLSFVLERRGNAWLLLHFAAACVGGEIVLRTMGSFGAGVKNDRPW